MRYSFSLAKSYAGYSCFSEDRMITPSFQDAD